MRQSVPTLPPQAGLRVGSREIPTAPVHLDGEQASVIARTGLEPATTARLHLDWGDGRSTDLEVRVERVRGVGPMMELTVCGVHGDWQPFLEYVGHQGR